MSKSRSESMSWGGFVENIVYQYLLKCDVIGVERADSDTDMNKHIDYTFYSKKLKKRVGIDVKAPTVVNGFGENEVNYATFVNNQGKPGWLYGEADFAFLVTFDEYIIVKLSELREFLEGKTDGQEAVNGNPKQLYTNFHCSNGGSYRKSVSTLFKIEDVKALPSAKVVKHSNSEILRKKFNEINKSMKSV